MRLDGETRLFPIIGDPIVYARSPELLTASLRTRGANAACVPLEVPRDALDPVMSGLSASRNVDGILVTMPHKHAVTAHCATLSETSRLLGAVSVIRRNEDGSWHGDSQDGSSFVKAQIDQGAVVEGSRVLLIGAGGAGSAIAIALLAGGARELVIHDIDETRVRDLIRLLGDRADGRAHHGPPDPRGCAMLCHATHLGMAEGDAMPIDPGLLDPSIFVGDVIAGHGVTPLIQAARDAGCRTATGDQMVEAVQSMMVDFMLGAWTEDHAGRE
ncbi:shikimate dehydrogenase family protein [Amaricoccus sp. W119]|uniref:shikimate dehydrogenase family protein n=1 Tax=Amaricoccus sp. W119 TaxID=3391833 RepID=UPI0039A5D4FB